MHLERLLLLDVRIPEALISVESARWLLGIDEDSVLAKIQCGAIRWAWDISIHRQNIREIRILSRCVTALFQGQAQPNDEIGKVVNDVVGVVERQRLRASRVKEILTCSQQHVQRLVSIGALSADVARGTRWVDRASFVQFLHSRLIV